MQKEESNQFDDWESVSTHSLESSHTASTNMSEQHCQINIANHEIHVDQTTQACLSNTYNNQQSNTLQSTNLTDRVDGPTTSSQIQATDTLTNPAQTQITNTHNLLPDSALMDRLSNTPNVEQTVPFDQPSNMYITDINCVFHNEDSNTPSLQPNSEDQHFVPMSQTTDERVVQQHFSSPHSDVNNAETGKTVNLVAAVSTYMKRVYDWSIGNNKL